MARALSHIHSVIRGSVGGLTYFPNQFHQICMRHRTTPVNPMTPRQVEMRGALSDANALWLLLSAADRELWNQYAQTLYYIGPLGNYQIPGRQVFISNCGLAKYLDGRGVDVGTFGTDPPIIPGFLDLLSVEPVAPASGIGFSITFSNPNHESIAVYSMRSIPFNPTRYRFKGPFLTETLDSVNLPSATSGIIEYTDLNENSIYFTFIRAISDEPPYRICAERVIRAIAEAAAP
jgi:hypothetical protein